MTAPQLTPAAALARAIADDVHPLGGRALIVGGWVRDLLRQHPSKDVDMEVFGVPQEALASRLTRFGRVEAVGQSFPVYKVVPPSGHADAIDVALPRRESKTARGHRGFAVEGDPFMSLTEAATRRDFTINALAFDPRTGEVLDPTDRGLADLRAGRLRAVDLRTFGDDSLRVLRAMQFAARFGMGLDADTAALCRQIPLDDLPSERIWGELEKLLLQADQPSIGMALALDLGIVDRLWPELRPLVGCPQEPEWHPEGDVWVHTLLVLDQAAVANRDLARGERLAVMLAALCHDLGKPATTAVIDGRIRSLNHEEAGVAPTLSLLDRLGVHACDGYDVRGQVVGLVAHHLKPGMLFKAGNAGDGAFRRLAQKVNLELLARVARADCNGRREHFDCSAMDWFIDRARALGVEHQPPPPLLLGRHVLALGVPPGPRVGAILKMVYDRQLDGHLTTVDEAVAAALEVVRPR